MTFSPRWTELFRQVVDLAYLQSAIICRDEVGQIVHQSDSLNRTHFNFAAEIARTALDPECEATFFEDVPHGIKSLYQVKPVLKFQGAIILACHKTLDTLFSVNPATWMNNFPGVQRVPKEIARGMTKTQTDKWRIAKAEEYAANLGYMAPDLEAKWIEEHPDLKPLQKYLSPLRKSKTDYVSAFLMSEFLSAYNLQDFPFQGVELAQI